MNRPPTSRARPVSLWLAAALVIAACRGADTAPEQEALQVVQRWAAAFHASDVDAIVALHAPDALFFGTGSQALVTSPEQVRDYFQGLRRDRPRGAELLEHSVKVLSDDVVLVTGLDRVTGVKEGKAYQADGRVSFVLERRDTGWKIVHFHRSALPGS